MDNKFGVNMWWYVPADILIDVSVVHAALEKFGFETDDISAPTRRAEVSRAAYSLQNRRSADNRKITEKARDDDETVVFGILARGQTGDEVSFEQSTKVELRKETGSVSVEGSLSAEFLSALDMYEGAIISDDIRYFLRSVIVNMTYGIPKRPSGGIYFVPAQFVSILESANDFLEELGVDARLYVERVVSGEAEREIVWESVETEIESQIESTLSTVERIGKRVSSVDKHQTRLDGLGEIMDVYKGLLGAEAKYEEITERLKEAGESVSGKLVELTKKAEENGANPSKSERVAQAEIILVESGKAMTIKELAEAGIEKGVFSADIGNPVGSVNASITKAIKDKLTKISRVRRGVYQVKVA